MLPCVWVGMGYNLMSKYYHSRSATQRSFEIRVSEFGAEEKHFHFVRLRAFHSREKSCTLINCSMLESVFPAEDEKSNSRSEQVMRWKRQQPVQLNVSNLCVPAHSRIDMYIDYSLHQRLRSLWHLKQTNKPTKEILYPCSSHVSDPCSTTICSLQIPRCCCTSYGSPHFRNYSPVTLHETTHSTHNRRPACILI